MSFVKYLTDTGERKKARTQDGFPIRGDRTPFLKQQEFENIELGLDAHVKVFATDKIEQMVEYETILDKIANGLFVRLAPEKEEFVESRQCWLILVRWAEVKGELSPQLLDAIGGYRS